MTPESMLAHLAPLLTSQLENVAASALAHLLTQYPLLAEALRETVSPAQAGLPGELTFKARARWRDASQPDAMGLDAEGRPRLIVESKFWAPLAPNQPEVDLNRLPEDQPGVLLFIVPATRAATFWGELLHRRGARRQAKAGAARLFSTALNAQHVLALTSWEDLLAAFREKAAQAQDPSAAADIWQLQSLCAKINADAFQPLSEEEVLSPTQKRIAQYRDLINDLVTLLESTGVVAVKGARGTPGSGFYRRTMDMCGYHDWCIEFNQEYSEKYPTTSLWLTNTVTPKIAGLLADFAPASYRDGKQLLIPLEIPLGMEREAVLASLYQQIHDVSDHLIEW